MQETKYSEILHGKFNRKAAGAPFRHEKLRSIAVIPPLSRTGQEDMTLADRLDVLIYGHDGRGLGHASRSIAVGMAMRRLYPDRKVLFVSGSNFSQELIGPAPLDWLKLPSYATRVVDGRVRGVAGPSMFDDQRLGELRAHELRHLVSIYRPRLVLVDHTPQGKHRELVPALKSSSGGDTRWILGVRGVVGEVSQSGSKLARQLFSSYFHGLLWYGDRGVLGDSHSEVLRRCYGRAPLECGYVLRFAELEHWISYDQPLKPQPVGTVSVPWLGEKSLAFLTELAGALRLLPPEIGPWHLFIGTGGSLKASEQVARLFADLHHCRLERPGAGYIRSLLSSRVAVIYGGYNSLMDVLHAGVSALVVLREMQDDEQQLHLHYLQQAAGGSITTLSESRITGLELGQLVRQALGRAGRPHHQINTNGAPNAANYLESLLAGN